MPKQGTEEEQKIETGLAEARSAEVTTKPVRASFDLLNSKTQAEKELALKIPTENGLVEATFLFRSIGVREYDKIVTAHPPTTEQRANGDNFNIHRFAPALLARVCIEPSMEASQWEQIWNSPNWNRGEVTQLFWEAVGLCNQGMDELPLSGDGSERITPSP